MRLLQRFINDPSDLHPFSHGSFLFRAGPQELGCVWFSGSLEGHDDVVIRHSVLDGTRSPSHLCGPQWSHPRTIAGFENTAVGNPVIFIDGREAWHLFFVRFPPRQSRHSELLVQTSDDQGRNWGPARTLSEKPGFWPRHPVVVQDGAWLLPVCNVHDRPPRSAFWRSENLGQTWQLMPLTGSERLIQPILINTVENELQVYLRDMDCKAIHRAVSGDGGQTWSTPEATELPNNNSGIHVLALENGHLLAAFTDQTDRDRRSPVILALSQDFGHSWPIRRELLPYVDIPASLLQYSYPSMIQTVEETVHLTLTYESRRIAEFAFDEQWIKENEPCLVTPELVRPAPPKYGVRKLRPGEPVYLGDKTARLLKVPEYLYGQLAICPVNTDQSRRSVDDEYLTGRLTRPAWLYVAYDASITRPPRWLSQFEAMDGRVETSIGNFSVFRKSFDRGPFRLGGNNQQPTEGTPNMYFAFLADLPRDGGTGDRKPSP